MTILQSLAAFYDRLDRRAVVPRPGYGLVGVSFAIPISRDGTVDRAIDIRNHDGRRPLPVHRTLPWLRDHNNSGKDPFLFWDNTGYALGIVKKEMKRGTSEGLFEQFKAANLRAIDGAISLELAAFRAFLLQWRFDKSLLGIDDSDLDSNVVFRSIETGRLIHEVDEAGSIWQQMLLQDDVSEQLCLVSGELRPKARLHPKFPSLVTGGKRAPVVSFNEKAFESYEKEQGDNAPVSAEAAFKYGAALTWLLDRSNSRAFRLGETTVVFWADEKADNVGEEAAAAVEDEFWTEVADDDGEADAVLDEDGEADADDDAERDIDAEEAPKITREARNVEHLRKPPDTSKLDPRTRLHVLGLSPNSGRIAVRFWLVDTWGHLAENIARHKQDITIHPSDRSPDQKAYALLYETAVLRKKENIPQRLGGELARAILTGGRYPRTLFASVIARIRADKTINAARAGICKAVINRDHDEEVLPVALNPDSDDEPYNLGRLFAVYEYAERSVASRNATIRDKYIGAASATPRRVFPILMRGYEHNASGLAKGEGNQRGAGIKAARAVAQILSRFGGEMPFPTALKLEEQGRFFVGYYHQMAALYTKTERNGQDSDGEAEGSDQ